MDVETAVERSGTQRRGRRGGVRHPRPYPAGGGSQTEDLPGAAVAGGCLASPEIGYRRVDPIHPEGFEIKDGALVLYTLLVIIAAIVLAVIVLNLIRSGGRAL